ncbi:hypothetical protein HDV63DRAFT_409668 [Trichoderma sp. SZMC 28014]
MSYSDVLNTPNLRHKLRPEVLEQVDRILTDLPVEMRPLAYEFRRKDIDLSRVEYCGSKYAVKGALHNKIKELAAVEKLIRILYEEYHAGNLDTAYEEYCSDDYKLYCRHRTLENDVIVLGTSGQEIENRICNDICSERRSGSTNVMGFVNEAYMDSLIAPYKTPEGAKIPFFGAKNDAAEKDFRDKVLTAYEAKRGKLAWCVVSGQWRKAKDITAFDIIQHRNGERSAQNLLGRPDNKDGHLMGTKNGLPMHRIYAEAFRNGYLVLLPTGSPDNGQASFSRWKVSFWGEFRKAKKTANGRHKGLPWGSKLDGRELKFQNQFRPAAQYVFALYCKSILSRQKYEAPGWWRTCFDSSSADPGPPTFHLRASYLRRLARKPYLLAEEEAAEFAAHNTFPRAPDDSKESEAPEAVDDETMDAFLADVSEDPSAPLPTSPLTEESNDSMDAIEVEIDGEMEVQGEDSEHWEEVDDEYRWGDTWVEVDEDVDEYADEVEDRDRDIY